MLKGSMIAAVAAVSALVVLLAMPGSSKTEAALPDNGERDAYSVSDYYGGEYDWPRLKLAEPSTKQSITRDIVPQVESLTPDQLARLAKQDDFCSGPFSIRCFGIPTSKLRGYVEWALGRHVHTMAIQSALAAERSAASERQANTAATRAGDIASRAIMWAGLSIAIAVGALLFVLWKALRPASGVLVSK
ncbi:hypothetical protein [Nitrobacter sp. TKz-YC02]|uniref:hypothetical protein n=1 Tax=Nitrobacter sp. TKz-YC02 TaxID=3398704 RepID=UPI003CEEC5A7